MAVAAVNCPVTATEVWKAVARATKSGPNIRPTVMARKIAAARHTSKTAEGKVEAVIHDSCRRRAPAWWMSTEYLIPFFHKELIGRQASFLKRDQKAGSSDRGMSRRCEAHTAAITAATPGSAWDTACTAPRGLPL